MFKIAKINPVTGEAKYLDFQEFIFPAGEVSVKLNAKDYAYKALDLPNTIIARIQNSDDLFRLALLKDAVARLDSNPINLFMPYSAYARQDRVCDAGESLSVAVFARYIASLGFAEVTIIDPHSNVTPAAFEALGVKLTVITQLDILNKFTDFIPTLLKAELVSPDAGSSKKTADIASWLEKKTFIRVDKLRDLTNGQIKEIVVYTDDLQGQNVVILDDLIERGGTFIGLAAKLKEKKCGKIVLYATHGIFGGVKEYESVITNLFKGGIDEIWTTNSYHRDLIEITELKFPNLHVFDIEKFLI